MKYVKSYRSWYDTRSDWLQTVIFLAIVITSLAVTSLVLSL